MRRTVEYDDRGQESESYAAVGKPIAARVQTLTGRELEQARQTVSDASLKVTIRHLAGLVPTDQFLFKERTLHIGHVGDPEERGRWMICYCSETKTPNG